MRVLLAAIVVGALPPSVHPWPIGVGPRYHPAPGNHALPCRTDRVRFDAHVEVFAARRVAILPAGIGRGANCTAAVSTNAPTGVVRLTGLVRLGDLFRVWGQALGPRRLLSFRGTTLAFVNGNRWHGDPRRIWLTRHAQVVLEIGGYVAPHPSYLFPKGAP